MSLLEKFFAGIQTILPHHLLSALVHRLMRIKLRWIKNALIYLISEFVDVDWSECKLQSISDFDTFNDFFTRELAANARPLPQDSKAFVSPSDGKISEAGRLRENRIIQAKGRSYSVQTLLASDPSAADFAGGYFHTIYLSPRDYHRVHMPFDGVLQRVIHVPGRLFSVAPYAVRQVPNLFARNERVISIFETSNGPMAVVLVGAMLVSSMETVWSGVVTPPRGRRITHGDWSNHHYSLKRGDELGRFNMGSTVILLMTAAGVSSVEDMEAGDPVIMGQKLGRAC